MAHELSAKTRRIYEGAWRHFADWCADRDIESVPAMPEDVRAYAAQLSNAGLRASAISVRLSAINAAPADAGLDRPFDGAGMRDVMRDICPETRLQRTTPRHHRRTELLRSLGLSVEEILRLKPYVIRMTPNGIEVRVRVAKSHPSEQASVTVVPEAIAAEMLRGLDGCESRPSPLFPTFG